MRRCSAALSHDVPLVAAAVCRHALTVKPADRSSLQKRHLAPKACKVCETCKACKRKTGVRVEWGCGYRGAAAGVGVHRHVGAGGGECGGRGG